MMANLFQKGPASVQNLELVDKVRAVAARHDCTPGQVALAWLHAQVLHVVVVPRLMSMLPDVSTCAQEQQFAAVHTTQQCKPSRWTRQPVVFSCGLSRSFCPWLQGPDVVPIPCVPSFCSNTCFSLAAALMSEHRRPPS